MSLPPVLDFRRRVESINDLAKRRAFQTVHLICGRVGEVISETCPGDRNAMQIHPKHTGYQLSVSKAVYQPDPEDEGDRAFWMLKFALQGKQLSLGELAEAMYQIKEPVAVFTVYTEKRGGLKREVALPLDPKYDPWVSEVFSYLSNRMQPYFPFTRQDMWNTAREAFEGFKYSIMPYSRAKIIDGAYVRNEKGKVVRFDVPEHTKDFSDHGVRHLRASELRNFYKLSREERAVFGGWTVASLAGGSSSQDRYEEAPWRTYFPKMLRRRLND